MQFQINKQFVAITLIVVLCLSLTGCGKSAVATKDGNSLKITKEDLEKEGREGIFVLNEDKTLTPILTSLPGYSGGTKKSDPSRYIWFTDNKHNVTNIIPEVTPKTPLVAIYNSNSKLPGELYLEKYDDKGYTIGAHIYTDDNKSMILYKKNTLDGTTANDVLSLIEGSDEEYQIESISGTKNNVLPIGNVDNNMELLLGFQKGKLFNFKFFRGTKTEEVELKADTRVFQSSKITELKDPYKKTSQGYFIINLPLNLSEGYYYLSDIGFFRYSN